MVVRAEIRDLSYKKKMLPTILPLIIEPVLVLVFAAFGFTNPDTIPSWVTVAGLILGLILFLVLTVMAFVKANKIAKTSWLVEKFEFVALNGKLTVNGKTMHTEVIKSRKVIYVHDMGDNGKPYQATFYATVREDFTEFLQYIEENGVKMEKENLPRGAGKYGWAVPLTVNKYRRY